LNRRLHFFGSRGFNGSLGRCLRSCAPTTLGWRVRRAGRLGLRLGCRSGWCSATTPTSGSRRSGNARALLALPTGADARNLIVAQRTQMTPHRNVHLTKEIDHLVAWNSKLTRQIMYSKLAQPYSSPSLRPSGIGVGLSARIPFAKPRSTIPTTAVASRPTAAPSSAAAGPARTVIPRA
jgi:hypothetical protein